MIRLRLMTVFTIAAALVAPVLAQNAGTTNMDILRQKQRHREEAAR